MKLNVAAAQFASKIADVDANLGQHYDWAQRASGTDLLVFPELSMTGHYGAEQMLDVAMKADDRRLLELSRAAEDTIIVVGFVEEGPSAQFYNSAGVYKRGKLVHLHRKVNLTSYGLLLETRNYSQGTTIDTLAMVEDWRLGLLLCADIWNPALVHLSFLRGATLLVAPASSGMEAVGEAFDDPMGWEKALGFYAMMYGAPTIFANRVGTEEDLTFWGGSRILDPYGTPLAVAGQGPQLIQATLDYADVRQARAQLPTVRDSNLGLLARETGRLMQGYGLPAGPGAV